MTQPPTGGTLGGGFESGDDFIAARVSIDIPTEGIAGLREITQEMDRFRTSVEAANRSSETFTGYLQRIAEAANQAATAQENLVSILENTTDFQNRVITSGAGGVPQLNAPAQFQEHWSSDTPGMGGGGGHGGEDINGQLDALRTQNPRAYVNKMAASGHYRSGDIPATSPTGSDIQNAANRINERAQITSEGEAGMGDIGSRSGRMGAIAQQVMNEINPGANPLGVSGMVQRGLGAIGNVANLPGMGPMGAGLGRVAALAGPMAGAIGLGLAGYGLVQGAGGIYQDYKNMGMVRGGGAAEGVGYELSIRTMAMNPFLSSDQSRQIIQQGLRDGYTGKEFDTVTAMVAQNVKDFNMEVGESFRVLRKNVIEGGQSGVGLTSDLQTLKQLSAQGGYLSNPVMRENYENTTAALIGAGMQGDQAGRAALLGGQMFSNNALLAGTGNEIVQAFGSNPQDLAIMKYQGGINVPQGLMPQAMPYMMSGDALAVGGTETLKKFAMQAYRARGNPPIGSVQYYNAVATWGMRVQQMGLPFANEPQKVEEMFRSFIQGENPLAEANKQVDETKKSQTQLQTRNPLSMLGGGLVSMGAAVGTAIGSTIGNAAGTVKDVFTDNIGNIDDRWSNWWKKEQDRAGSVATAASPWKIDMLNNLNDKYGPTGYEILDKNQKVVKDFNPFNVQQMKDLSEGDLRWRPKGSSGAGYTIGQTPTGSDGKMVAGGKTEVSGAVTITLTPEAQKLLQVQGGNKVSLTPHEAQANSGYGQATPNNAPPGYDGPRRY